MLDRKLLKSQAREINRSAVVSAYLFSLIYLIVTNALSLIDIYVSGSAADYMQRFFPDWPVTLLLSRTAYPPLLVTFVSVAVFLLLAVLEGGYVLYALGVRQHREMPYATLFDGFGFVGKLILVNLVIGLFVGLWGMLFIIPGIIAAYRYRFAVYNLCENPDIGVMEAIEMSKVQTSGFKWDLFVLDLSFFGWGLLSSFTAGLLLIWLFPYMKQTDLGYFQEIKQIKQVGYFPPSPPPEDMPQF